MKQAIKNIAPIFGGLTVGDGIARMYENNYPFGISELIVGISLISYVFYLILKK